MPSTFLTLQERARLTCCPNAMPQWDLIPSFPLTEQDSARIDPYLGDTNRWGAALQLCAVRSLGFCPAALQTASSDVTTFLARQRQVEPSPLQDEGTRRLPRSTPFHAVWPHLGLRRVPPDDHAPMVAWGTERALAPDTPTLVLHRLCARLKPHQMIRPAVTTVERWVVTARLHAQQASLHRLQFLLTPERIPLLDRLLGSESDQGPPPLSRLRQHAASKTPTAVLHTRDTWTTRESWEVDAWAMAHLHPHRQKFLARLGRQSTRPALRRLGPERRYPLFLACWKQTLLELTDESIAIGDVCIASRHKKAQKALQEYQPQIVATTETHSQLLQPMGAGVVDETVRDAHRRQAIYHPIPRATLQVAVKEAHALRRPSRACDFRDAHDRSVRQCAPQLWRTLGGAV